MGRLGRHLIIMLYVLPLVTIIHVTSNDIVLTGVTSGVGTLCIVHEFEVREIAFGRAGRTFLIPARDTHSYIHSTK